MTLTELRNLISSKCPHHHRDSRDHSCRVRLAGCFLFDTNSRKPDYCNHFQKIINISVAQLDRIWQNARRKTGQKDLLKRAVIERLLSTGKVTQKEIINRNLIPERLLKYHWLKIMQGLWLKWRRGEDGNYRCKVYYAPYRKKRVLRQILRQENKKIA